MGISEGKRTTMKREAVALMDMLGVDRKTIAEFENENIVRMTIEGRPPQELSDHVKALIDEYEDNEKMLVYHVVAGGVNGVGVCVNLLCVGKYEEDYPIAQWQALHGRVAAFVYNETCPEDSEWGFISVVNTPHLYRIG